MTLVMYSSAPTPERACLEKSQYAVHVNTLATANSSPQPLNDGVPADPIATTETPTSDNPTNTMSRRSTRSPNHLAAPIMMHTGASAPMIVASATLVSRNARKLHATSAVKITPPSAHVRSVAQRSRRPVTTNTAANTSTPIHNRYAANVSVGIVICFRTSGARPQMTVVVATARMPAVRLASSVRAGGVIPRRYQRVGCGP